MKNKSLAAQFRHTFLMTLAACLTATVLTYVLAAALFAYALDRYILPANYYQQQVSDVAAYVREKNRALLSPSEESGLKHSFQGDGMLYQVVDCRGNLLYGTNVQKPFASAEELFDSFADETVIRQGYYIYTVPITEESGEYAGAVLLFYHISPTFANHKGWMVSAVLLLALLSPFFYMIGFTLLFSRIFAKNVNAPLQLLTEASKKIKEKNLDFEINYSSDNELGRLCSAFSEMKEELKKSLSAQWEMEQERVWMAESLAHDLKSPLSIILGYTDSLLENTPDDTEKLRRYLTVIRNNTKKSTALVQQMQYASDLERSGLRLEPSPLDIAVFLTQKVQDYQLPARQKGITLSLHLPERIPRSVCTDADKLARILDNVISNSLQYTPQGGRIDISVKAEKDRLRYIVCDTGSGFAPKDLKKALDKFYRGDESRQSKGGHSGLGLYIAAQLAGQLGGSVEIGNTKAGGACVTFWHSI